MIVRDGAGARSFFACLPKAWAESNLIESRYVDITMLADGSLRIAPAGAEGKHEY